MHGHADMGGQGVQEGAEHVPLWGPSVKDQRRGVVSYLHHLGVTVRKSRTQLHRGGFRTRASRLEGTMVWNAEL